jgi:hypothetical protein
MLLNQIPGDSRARIEANIARPTTVTLEAIQWRAVIGALQHTQGAFDADDDRLTEMTTILQSICEQVGHEVQG